MTVQSAAEPPPPRGQLSRLGGLNTAIGLLAAALTFTMLALIASKFGGSRGSDAYFFMFSLATVGTALLGGMVSAVMLPQFVEARVRTGLAQASDLASHLLGWVLLLCALLVIALAVFHDAFFSLASRFPEEQLHAQRSILGWLGPVLFFSVLAEYLRLLLLGSGSYVSAALMALITPLVLVVLLLAGDSIQENSLAPALALSRALMLAVALVSLWRAGVVLRPSLRRHAGVARFMRVSAPYGPASLVTHLSTFFFDYMASGLGAGVLTAVTLAHRVFALPLMLLVTPVLEIARVRLAEYQARGDLASFQRQYAQLSVLVLYLALPSGVLFFVFPQDIISLLFQRGAFSPQDVEVATDCLRVLAWSVPLGCFFTLNGRVVESFQQLGLPALLGSMGNLSLIALTFVLVGALGYVGIPLARLSVDLVFLLPLGIWLLRRHGVRVDMVQLLGTLGRAAIACALPVGLALVVRDTWASPASPPPAGWAVMAVAAMGAMYAALVLWMDAHSRAAVMAIRGGT
jgi:putative peptidoglycan lipid II flippase